MRFKMREVRHGLTVCLEFGLPDPEDDVFDDESVLHEVPTLGWFGETGDFMSALVTARLFPKLQAERNRLGEIPELNVEWGAEEAKAMRAAVSAESSADHERPRVPKFEDEEILGVLDRGNDIHMEWLASGWASCDPGLESLLDMLDEALEAGPVGAARRIALELRDAVRERA